MPSRADLAIYQGDDYAATVDVLDSTGASADLTGYTALAQIRRDPTDGTVAATLQTSVAKSGIALYLPGSDTAALYGSYAWDLEIQRLGIHTTILCGWVSVASEVSRG